MTLAASALASGSLAPPAYAQQAASTARAPQLTPVQPIRSTPQPRAATTRSAASGQATLRWQASSRVTSPTAKAATATAATATAATAKAATAKAGATEAPAVARVAYVQDDAAPTAAGSFALPRHGGGASRSERVAADPFLDPFNDGPLVPPASDSAATEFEGESLPTPEAVPAPEPLAVPEPVAAPEPIAVPQNESRFSGQLQAPNPFSPQPAPEDAASGDRFSVPSPSDQQSGGQRNGNQQSVVQDPAGGELRDRSERAVDIGRRPSQRIEPSCEELRQRIAERTIRKVTLDISPPFRPDILEQDEYAKLRAEFIESQEIRDWRSLDGRLLGRGRLIDMAFEQAIIEGEDGAELALPMSDLSEPDLEYITSAWGLPRECQLPQIAYEPRQWLPTKMTWKASELCHKPLYFEEVNLERYGHTAGPFAQPVVSTAHFFFNIAVLPYKMGIHPPNECQYALGYYRPGNCAPWIIPPVPLSLRGAVAQTAVVGGMVALIP